MATKSAHYTMTARVGYGSLEHAKKRISMYSRLDSGAPDCHFRVVRHTANDGAGMTARE
ncbi:MAG: hypothetical protein U5K56_10045 [Halioglobus sp.]|nr:hypothetical protein [Halioglobus sp.]